MILLDTNVLSEALRSSPSPTVIQWLDARFAECAISSIAIFELNAGVAMLARGKRRTALEATVERTIRRFGARVYPFDAPAALAAVKIMSDARAAGLGLHQIPAKLPDLQTAGIAAAYGLDLATRNVGDFAGAGLSLINPWQTDNA